MKTSWECCYGLNDVTLHETFEDAFRELYRRVKEEMDNGTLSIQLLETACWIKSPDSKWPLMFYDARDRACRSGLLKDGKIQDKGILT